tara:strand:+ start:294 stop:467 length:174 start_codon:yes stop_codon:yes gene_type:complete
VGYLRITKVDLIAKGRLRSFATFTEATHPEGALLLEDGVAWRFWRNKKSHNISVVAH